MKKSFLIVILLCCLFVAPTYAYSLEDVNTLSRNDVKKIVGNKIFDFSVAQIAVNNGQVFMLTRDNKTRKMEWVLLDTAKKKIVAQGNCPFQAFFQFAISPDASTAVAISRYPASLWSLNLNSGKWKQVYQPPKNKAGLFFLSVSPLDVVDSNTAISVLDQQDAEGYVNDSFVVKFNLEGDCSYSKVFSLNELNKKTFEKVGKDLKASDKAYSPKISDIIFGANDNYFYSFNIAAKNYLNGYIFQYLSAQTITEVDKNGSFYPLDYNGSTLTGVYRKIDKDEVHIMFYSSGKTVSMGSVKAINASIMKDDLVGVIGVEGKSIKIYMGKPGEKLQLVKTLKEPFSGKFSRDGRYLILMNNEKIKTFRIGK
ncbi:MAG: hypothetical protein ACLFQV_02815 [Vulcanimicrobiota bacterium]